MDKLKGRVGESYRVSILTINACNAVYSNNRYVLSEGDENAKLRFGSTIVKYEPDINGWLITSMSWFFGYKTFEELNRASKGYLKHQDLIVTCVQEDYQQFSAKLCPVCIWKSDKTFIDTLYRNLSILWESMVLKLAEGFTAPGLSLQNDNNVDRHWSELFPIK